MSKKSKKDHSAKKLWVAAGATATILLLVVSGLSWYGYKFSTSMVRDRLVAQKIYFPEKGSPALDPKEFPDLQQYAGQQVDDGLKAKAYADGFIGRHLQQVADGKTYAEVSALAMKNPDDQKLQGQKQALFTGETLRGLLLGNAYAYWTLGMVAKAVSLAALLLGIIVALVTGRTLVSSKGRK